METPNKMIGGIAGTMAPQIDPATGAPVQPGQLLQNDISPTALGGAQATTIPAMFPQTTQPRVLNNTMPQNI